MLILDGWVMSGDEDFLPTWVVSGLSFERRLVSRSRSVNIAVGFSFLVIMTLPILCLPIIFATWFMDVFSSAVMTTRVMKSSTIASVS